MPLIGRPAPDADLPALPPLAQLALLLDLDGTLLDLALTPAEVRVPPLLPRVIRRLAVQLAGALAIVSGRLISEVDLLLPGLTIAVAGEHGAALRRAPGLVAARVPLPALPPGWCEMARRLAAAHPGVALEQKPHGFVLHYRGAEDSGPGLGAALQDLIAGAPGEFELVSARMAWELRPAGVDKGTAVRRLLERPPFAGRVPVFVGDDVTDLDGIRAARRLGGFGFSVGPTFGDARGVRAWLEQLAEAGESCPESG